MRCESQSVYDQNISAGASAPGLAVISGNHKAALPLSAC